MATDLILSTDIKVSTETTEKLISENPSDVVIDFLCDVIIEGCCEDQLFYDNFSRILESRFKDEE